MNIVQQLQDEAKLLESRGLMVTFYPKSVKDEAASKEAGYAQFKTVDYIKIQWDNDDSVVDRPVMHSDDDSDYWYLHSDLKKYPMQWQAYQSGQQVQIVGIPIENLFFNDPGKADTYKHANIHTIEQLAETADSILQRFMGGIADKQTAQKYLAKAKDNFALEQLSAETNNVKEENDFLKLQMKELQLQMSRLVEEKLKAAHSEPVEEKKTKKKGQSDED